MENKEIKLDRNDFINLVKTGLIERDGYSLSLERMGYQEMLNLVYNICAEFNSFKP